MAQIIGREKEKQVLQRLYDSSKAEFVVVYGRRRVGKTFLVREFLKDKIVFHHTALAPGDIDDDPLVKLQIQNFCSSFLHYGIEFTDKPNDWIEAFDILINWLSKMPKDKRVVVFIDELPWLDTPRSGFVSAFEHFWNGWGAGQENLMLVVCGSATSWISDKLLGNKGGLYGRTTYELHLQPFTLKESEAYFQSEGVVMDRYDQLQCYMIMGGIPYYLSYIEKGKSFAQNIDDLIFSKKGKLTLEFERLYNSIFTAPDNYVKVVKLLAQKRDGYTRAEIAEKTKIPYGGGLTKILQVLEVSDFIVSYNRYKAPKREIYYKLVDFYSIFYLKFVEGNRTTNSTFWQNNQMSPRINTWRGYAFEDVCWVHINQLKTALGIAGVQAEVFSWFEKGENEYPGAQIDMLIDRADRVINLCEMKFSLSDFIIDKSYDAILRRKMAVFMDKVKPKKALHQVLVTTYGVYQNEYSGRIQNVITMDDLFK